PDSAEAAEALDAALRAAHGLPGEGWLARLAGGTPQGPTETFLALVRQQVQARAAAPDGPYSLETETRPPVAGLVEAGAALSAALDRLIRPLNALRLRIAARLDDEAEELDSATRLRIEGVCRTL